MGYLPIVKLLLDRGANINARTNHRHTALTLASIGGYLSTVKLLLDRGANINARIYSGTTPLIFAAWQGHLPVVKLLINRGANTSELNTTNENINENMKNAIMKHIIMKNNAGRTILKYHKAATLRRRAAATKALNNVRTPTGRPLPPNAIRSIMNMLKPRSPK
jgi:ankyrin repeat protein